MVCKTAEVGTTFQMRSTGESREFDKGGWCDRRVIHLVEAPGCEVDREYERFGSEVNVQRNWSAVAWACGKSQTS